MNGRSPQRSGSRRVARFFTVLDGGRLFLKKLTLRDGAAAECPSQECYQYGGGAVASFGGLVWLERCAVTNNTALQFEGAAYTLGGGILSVDGYLRLRDEPGSLHLGPRAVTASGTSQAARSSLNRPCSRTAL